MTAYRKQSLIENLLSDLHQQPEWRTEAAVAEAYYEGRHLLPEVEQAMRERGQPVIINNYVAPTINGVLGMEAKSRTDWQVRADDEEGALVNEYLNERLNEAARMSGADRANSDAFACQVKSGAGFVEVRRNDDLFGDPYIVDTLDWTSVWWDWRSRRADWKDCRYVVIERWMDEDQALLVAPKHKDLVKGCLDGWPALLTLDSHQVNPDLVAGWQITSQSSLLTNEQWNDSLRRRVRFFDIYYRKFDVGQAMVSRNGETALFNKNNPLHRSLVNAGHVQLKTTRYARMFRAIYLGPHLIHDGPSPYPHNEFPVVPFFGYREGRSRVPYGLIRAMMGPQDELNFRRSTLTWLLKARQVIMDSDAVAMTDSELHSAVARVDGIIKLNPNRKNKESGFKIRDESNIAAQQFQVMQDAEKQIQSVSGVYNAMLGRSDGGATSGIAINSLVEQGTVTMAELYDNFRTGKQLVGNLLLNLIAEDIGNEERQVKVYASNPMKKTETLILNQRADTGEVTNQVSMLSRKVVLADISSSPGYRAQMLERLMALAATVPDNIKLILLNDILELSELPRKAELMKKIQQAIGQGVDPNEMDEAARAEHAAAQQRQQMALAVEMATQQAVLAEAQAKAQLTQSQAELAAANAELASRKAQTEQEAPALMAARAKEILAKITGMVQQQDIQSQQHSADQRANLDALIKRMMANVPAAA